MFLRDAAVLFATPLGSLAYHLTLGVTLALLFSLTHVYAHRSKARAASRWRLAAAWLLALHLGLVATSSVTELGALPVDFLVPPLSHFTAIAGLLLLGWVILFPEGSQIGDGIVLGGLALGIVGLTFTFVAILVSGEAAPDAQWRAAIVWRVAGLAIALLAGAGILIRQPFQWPLSASAFAILVLGYVVQLALGPIELAISGYVRITDLMAYPILAVLGVRSFMLQGGAPARTDESALAKAPLPAGRATESDLAVQFSGLLSTDSADSLAKQATRALAQALLAEYCLILSPPDERGQFAIATGYDLIREKYVSGAALDERSSPVIASALTKRRSLHLSSQSRSPDVYTLQSILELPSPGPALLVPIVFGDDLYGGLLLLSPYARRSWSVNQRLALETIAGNLGNRLRQLGSGEPIGRLSDEEAYQALREAQSRVNLLEQENMGLFEALHAQGHDFQLPETSTFATLETELAQAEDTISILEAEIERLKAAKVPMPALPTSEEMEQLTSELQAALQELVSARIEISRLQSQASDSREVVKPTHVDLEAISTIAQELRQPMSSIMGYTELLLGESVGLLGAMQRKFLERVRHGIDRMGELLNDLIQVTALESGALDLSRATVEIIDCVEDAVTKAGTGLQERDVALRMDLPDELPPVMGDADAITQIVYHLLRNAIAASPQGEEVVLSARLQQAGQEGFAMLSVRDAGEGIPPDDLARVFQRLQQPDRVIIQGVGDAGIGLSLVKALSEALGGRVWVESEIGAGSTFTVLLPLATPDTGSVEALAS